MRYNNLRQLERNTMPKGKIITTLRLRREIEQQIRTLVEVESEDELSAQIAHIVAQGDATISTILANLETSDPHFRGALGLVASHLPHDEIAGALRDTARDESLPDQVRLTALMILERFLDEEVDAAALQGMHDPNQVVLQSLIEVTSESERDRSILVEYVRGLAEQPADLALLVLDALGEIEPANQVELLRMLAQDERAAIREQALAMLGQHRSPAASRAIQTLLPTSPDDLQPALQRMLRKLTLAGISTNPLPAPEPSWRALISAIDGRGNQSLWFLQEHPGTNQCRFLGILVNDQLGLQEAFGGDEITGQHFPPLAPRGALHNIPLRDSGFHLNLLETDFDFGRRLVLNGLQTTFQHGGPTPIEYRLLNDLLWGYSTEALTADVSCPDVSWQTVQALLPDTASLLDNPDFATWFLQSELIDTYAAQLRRAGKDLRIAAIPIQWVREVATAAFEDANTRDMYVGRLGAMSEWLLASGQERAARLAAAAARALGRVPPAEHPFILKLTQIGFTVAVHTPSHSALQM
jgi:hypothetical protein